VFAVQACRFSVSPYTGLLLVGIQSPVLREVIPIDLTAPFDDAIPHVQLYLLLSRDAPTFSLGNTPPGETKILSNLASPHLDRIKLFTARL